MFNASYETVTCAHVLSSLNNELKNDCIFFQSSSAICKKSQRQIDCDYDCNSYILVTLI